MNKTKVGAIMMGAGVLVAFWPLAMAFFATAPGHNMWSEGDPQSGGTYIWGMMITLPLGFVIGLIGFILLLTGAAADKDVTRPATPEELAATGADTVTETVPNGNSKGLGIVMIVLGAGVAAMGLPVMFSLIGGMFVLAGGFVIYRGIVLLKRSKSK